MANQTNFLAEMSEALAARTAAAKGAVAALQVSDGRYLTGTILQPDLVVASEQSLPKRDEFAVVLPGGLEGEARLVARDPRAVTPPTPWIRKIIPGLGADSIGRSADLRLIRGGALVTVKAVIEARPAA